MEKRISDVNRVNGTVFHTGGAHHLIKLAIGGMAYHCLDVASQDGLLDLLLRESLEVLSDGLKESQTCMVLAHSNVMAYSCTCMCFF